MKSKSLHNVFIFSFSSECHFLPACCRLVCRIAEVVGVYQISPSETKKLLLRLQARPVHLVRKGGREGGREGGGREVGREVGGGEGGGEVGRRGEEEEMNEASQ